MSRDLGVLESFRSHLLRWNRQINLVSRQETGDRLAGLLGQCVGGHEVLVDWLQGKGLGSSGRALWYFDLGSGGGLPGVVWHRLWVAAGEDVRTWLVEPREKRAWFLERAQAKEDGPGFSVLAGRWGELPVSVEALPVHPLVVISLKALHLTDDEVLSGWDEAMSGQPFEGDLVVARYYPPDQVLDGALIQKLGLDLSGGVRSIRDYIYKGIGVEVVPVRDRGTVVATLVLSAYRSSPRT